MTHTSGPWTWNVTGTELRGYEGQVLAVDLPEFISEADKRLIAAAPALLNLARVLKGELVMVLQLGRPSQATARLLEQVRVEIMKAAPEEESP